jgi:ArsR family transcriptional regulator
MIIIAYTHMKMIISMDIVYIFKALADENRIRILNLLRSSELCGCDIESVLCVKQSNASRHLNRLKIAGIIVSKQKSHWVYYRLNSVIFQWFPFLLIVINNEIEKISVCKEDLELLKKIKASGRTCNWLKNYSVYQKAYRCSFWKNLLYQNYFF